MVRLMKTGLQGSTTQRNSAEAKAWRTEDLRISPSSHSHSPALNISTHSYSRVFFTRAFITKLKRTCRQSLDFGGTSARDYIQKAEEIEEFVETPLEPFEIQEFSLELDIYARRVFDAS